jgi:trehalose 6-phosphate phosphatase
VTRQADQELASLRDRGRWLVGRSPLLVASDFDGTLADIERDPWAARIHGSSRRALRALAAVQRVRLVLFSGRTIVDLAARVRVGGAMYLGDHGVERAVAPRGFRVAALRIDTGVAGDADRRVARRLADAVPWDVPEPWLVVERKSAAVAFHFRAAPDLAAAGARVRAAVERHDGARLLQRHEGRRVLELRPRGAATKATTLSALVRDERPSAVIVLGDGPDDAEAFRAVRSAASAIGSVSLCIAVAGHPDVTASVATQADGVLASPRHVGLFLGSLARDARAIEAMGAGGSDRPDGPLAAASSLADDADQP